MMIRFRISQSDHRSKGERTFEIKLKTSLYKYIPEFFELLELMALFSIHHLRSLNPPIMLSSST